MGGEETTEHREDERGNGADSGVRARPAGTRLRLLATASSFIISRVGGDRNTFIYLFIFQSDGDKPIRNFLDDPRRSGPVPDSDRKEGSRRHVRNWGGLDFDNVKTGGEMEREWTVSAASLRLSNAFWLNNWFCLSPQSRRPGPKGSMDMTMSMTGRERAEYLRWKKEREQIDEERLARHRNATGQWRREWDAQKTDGM